MTNPTRIKIQLAAYFIFLANCGLEACYDTEMSGMKKYWMYGLKMVAFLLIFCWDYWFHYRKKRDFSIPPYLLFYISIVSWLFDRAWLFAGVNTLLLVFVSFWSRKTERDVD